MSEPRRRSATPRILVAILLLALTVAACTGQRNAEPPASAQPDRPSAAPPDAAALPSSSGLPPPPSELPTPPETLPSPPAEPHADPALEALLPSSIAGNALVTSSMTADQFVTADGAAQFSDFVAALGVAPESVSMALAIDPSHVQPGSLTALQADGVLSAADLLAALVSTDPSQPSTSDVSLGEMSVTRLDFPGAPSLFAYARGDVLFIAAGDDDESATAWLEALDQGGDADDA